MHPSGYAATVTSLMDETTAPTKLMPSEAWPKVIPLTMSASANLLAEIILYFRRRDGDVGTEGVAARKPLPNDYAPSTSRCAG